VLRVSWAGFAERWTLFAGAVLTVCLGVGLVQSSLLLLISAATLDAPAGLSPVELMRFDEGTLVAVALLGVTLGFSAFLAVFVISSTFAFTVAQRRRDLALLRLVGGSRRQLRGLLLGEAVLLGGVGSALGIPVGVALMAFQSWLLGVLGFVPAGFAGGWRLWIVAVSIGVGVGLAVAGVLVAARRAARVRPLEALRDTGEATRVMTAGRWSLAGLFAAGAVALIVLSPLGGAAGGQAMSVNVSICAAVALTALGPLLVPAVARLLPVRPGGVIGQLAKANLRNDVRRSASTAAPLIVLVGLVLGQAGALSSFAASGQEQVRGSTAADLVVEATGPVAARIAAVPGLAHASTEIEVPVALTTGSGDLAYTEIGSALVVDPAAYALAHPGSGSLEELRGHVVAAGPGGDAVSAGDTVGVRIGDVDLGPLPVVAAVPPGMGGGAALLLPAGLVPAELLADAPSRTFATLEPGADRQALAGVGAVRTVDEWLAGDAEARGGTSSGVLLVVVGLGGLYALIGVVNSVVIAGTARRREFAAARATGLTRRQVVWSALAESWAVTAIGVALGGLAAAGTLLAVLATTAAVTGTATVDVPWPLVFALVAGAFPVTGAASVLTTLAATRRSPVSLLAARE
jgi:putative ABC transport system permease protein